MSITYLPSSNKVLRVTKMFNDIGVDLTLAAPLDEGEQYFVNPSKNDKTCYIVTADELKQGKVGGLGTMCLQSGQTPDDAIAALPNLFNESSESKHLIVPYAEDAADVYAYNTNTETEGVGMLVFTGKVMNGQYLDH